MSSKEPLSKQEVIYISVAVIFFIAAMVRAIPDTVDDAYITFRSVSNVVSGKGLSFNAGEVVESFSNPLMVALLIPFAFLGFPLPIAGKLLGFLSLLVISYTVFKTIRILVDDRVYAVAGSALAVSFFPLNYYAVTGLETGVFAASLAALVYTLVRQEKFAPLHMGLMVLVILCRPEGLAFAVALLPSILMQWKCRWSSLGWWLGGMAIFGLALMARYGYFGDLMPNTYYAKPPGTADMRPGNSPVEASLRYVYRYLQISGYLLPLAAVSAWFFHPKDARLTLLSCLCGAGVVFAFYTGGDWFPGARYLLPISPLLIVLAMSGVSEIAGKLNDQHFRRYLLPLVYTSAMINFAFVLGEFYVYQGRYPYHVLNAQDNRRVGEWLDDNVPAGSSIVLYRIGAVGYYSDIEVVDLLGLIHRDIARVIAQSPNYHPSKEMGNETPAIVEAVRKRDPDGVLDILRNSQFATPEKRLYGYQFKKMKEFPQGEDQKMVLYWRKERLGDLSAEN